MHMGGKRKANCTGQESHCKNLEIIEHSVRYMYMQGWKLTLDHFVQASRSLAE